MRRGVTVGIMKGGRRCGSVDRGVFFFGIFSLVLFFILG